MANSDMQIEPYYGPTGGDFRSYSTSSAAVTPYYQTPPQKLKKDKRSWSLSDPEMQRKKRIVSYKAYTVQAKLKASFTRSFRWIKDLLSH
ncbi:hypothetical protein SASPL_116889 [Salvia splendens]|uniref:Uncharacterized protein n=1 Tax=Salvia splendens TaxID=180675 RepID=A0A8X8XWJ1_SALSN|nr:hypothetical protein SASPL_116889 [Salvia splendens]